VRKREGLTLDSAKVVHSSEEVEIGQPVQVKENGIPFLVDPLGGQKTGFFADQRDKRLAVQRLCSSLPNESVLLNCFSYTCAFSVYGALGNSGLKTINIDESGKALELGRENFKLNGILNDHHEFVEQDVFAWLKQAKQDSKKFEFMILDPPAFAKSQKDLNNGLKAYTKLNELGLSCCAEGGVLMTCSCSAAVSLDDLHACLKTAAGHTRRSVQLIETFKHGSDHPTNLAAPETEYLKVLLCRVL
jgi:23S rRNA (cytosine1962-C5)-methyltransferase